MITSLDNPRVKEVVRLRSGRERRRSGLFLAEGPREVERARAAGLRIVATYFAPELLEWDEGEEVSERVLAKMAYRAEPEGVLAVVEAPARELPRGGTLYLVAVGIEKPGNLGAMARTAEAAGADALVVADAQADVVEPERDPRVDRRRLHAAGRGGIARRGRGLGVQRRRRGRRRADALHRRRPRPPDARSSSAPRTQGLDERWRAAADVARLDPASRGHATDSLNAATAAAILLFEAVRQRG